MSSLPVVAQRVAPASAAGEAVQVVAVAAEIHQVQRAARAQHP